MSCEQSQYTTYGQIGGQAHGQMTPRGAGRSQSSSRLSTSLGTTYVPVAVRLPFGFCWGPSTCAEAAAWSP